MYGGKIKNIIMIYDGKTYQFDSIAKLKSFLYNIKYLIYIFKTI